MKMYGTVLHARSETGQIIDNLIFLMPDWLTFHICAFIMVSIRDFGVGLSKIVLNYYFNVTDVVFIGLLPVKPLFTKNLLMSSSS